MNAVFYHDDSQKLLAEKSRAQAAKSRGISVEEVQTNLLPVGTFTYAEEYHQKYYLTRYREIRNILLQSYPDGKSLADSSVATRMNAYLGTGMKKNWKSFLTELPKFGFEKDLENALEVAVKRQIAAEDE
jgi:peptide-methionine (S)-S-oxide reductase